MASGGGEGDRVGRYSVLSSFSHLATPSPAQSGQSKVKVDLTRSNKGRGRGLERGRKSPEVVIKSQSDPRPHHDPKAIQYRRQHRLW